MAYAPIELQLGPTVSADQLLSVWIAACRQVAASTISRLISLCVGLIYRLNPIKKLL